MKEQTQTTHIYTIIITSYNLFTSVDMYCTEKTSYIKLTIAIMITPLHLQEFL